MRVRHLIVGTALTLANRRGPLGAGFRSRLFQPLKKPVVQGSTTRSSGSTRTGRSSNRPVLARASVASPAPLNGVDIHTIGNSPSQDVVGGPGSQKPEHACDGKGIDYASACGLEG